MNIALQISAKDFPNVAAMLADAAAVRRRVRKLDRAVPVAPKPPSEEIARVIYVRRPKQLQHDSHVYAYRRWMMHKANGPCTTHIMARCAEAGLTIDVVMSASRERTLTDFRQMLMWEVKTFVQPTISYPALGRLFGGRDHTTALHGVNAHAKRIGL